MKLMKRQINLGGIIHTVELSDEETKDLMKELLDSNAEQLLECYAKVKEMTLEDNNPERNWKIALALFDKQATASYTVVTSALNEKQQELVKKLREKMKEKKG